LILGLRCPSVFKVANASRSGVVRNVKLGSGHFSHLVFLVCVCVLSSQRPLVGGVGRLRNRYLLIVGNVVKPGRIFSL